MAHSDELNVNAAITIPSALPEEVASWLRAAAQALVEHFAADLEGLVLFGSAAEGRLRASSDVNLLVVLRRFDAARAEGARALIQSAQAAIELHPMYVLTGELQLAAESFAVKFDDIASRHVLLYGHEPFGALEIPRPLLVHRVRQVLLNLTLRLRAIYMANPNQDETLALAAADAAAPLRRAAFAILELEGSPEPSPKSALEHLAGQLDGPFAADLKLLSQARDELSLPAGVAGPLVLRLAHLAEALQARARELGP